MAGNNKPSITQSAPAIEPLSTVDFDKKGFDDLIVDKGADVYHESAIKCPCRGNSSNAHQGLSDCLNCGGTGWFFINRTKTQMVLSSLNSQTKYSMWSEEKLGTVSISARDIDELSFMDKITVLKGFTFYTEVIHPKNFENKIFAFTSYDIVSVKYAFMFNNSKAQHTVLSNGVDFTIENNKILLDKKYKSYINDNFKISLLYKHRPTYHILDIPRDIMITDVLEVVGTNKQTVIMPIHAIGRKAHYIANMDNLGGARLFDNSTVEYNDPNEVCS